MCINMIKSCRGGNGRLKGYTEDKDKTKRWAGRKVKEEKDAGENVCTYCGEQEVTLDQGIQAGNGVGRRYNGVGS